MWTIDRVKDELNNLCKADGLPAIQVPVRINGRLTRTLGRVRFMRATCEPVGIEFARILLETGTDNDIMNVIKHEYVHYFFLVSKGEDHGHDAVFKKKCAEIGCEHDKTMNRLEGGEDYDKKFKYEIFCPDCNETIGTYSRMCKTIRNIEYCHCGRCGCRFLNVIQNW